mmetsp:Transcript_22539/g.59493  ORF Transcript_22539/g.59493 Transcript_22539/m.59493 type:complete len:502 (+) Transcript_22539:78-1583(+)
MAASAGAGAAVPMRAPALETLRLVAAGGPPSRAYAHSAPVGRAGSNAQTAPSSLSLNASQAAALLGAAAALGLRTRRPRRGARVAVANNNAKADVGGLDFGEDLVVMQGVGARRTGVLLLNIGTPASTEVADVREYLGRFLADDRVIDIKPPPLKAVLLQLLLATRPASSAENYKKVWDPVRGSPLLYHSQDLAAGLQKDLGDQYIVQIGMAYSKPFVADALRSLAASGVDDVLLVPMFPHYASSTTGSILANAYQTAAEVFCTPFLKVLPPFYNSPSYLNAMTDLIAGVIGKGGQDVDHLLFSFHGLPETQCSRTDTTESLCLRRPDCCAQMRRENRNCYRAQCFETARLLAAQLGLKDGAWSIGFQSRLTLRGTIQWIRPYTDEAIENLAERGVKRLAVVAPSFTADCVETIEELGITGREEFEKAGGEEFIVVPCLNSSSAWIRCLSDMLRAQLAGLPVASSHASSSGPSSDEPAAAERLPQLLQEIAPANNLKSRPR